MFSYTLTDTNRVIDDVASNEPIRSYVLKIKDMPSEDKPREKLLKYGPGTLSVSELIAVLLNTGTKKEDVMSMSHRMVKEYGEQSLAAQHNPAKMSADLSIPLAKTLQIVASFELGRRFFDRKSGRTAIIRSAKDAYRYVSDMYNLPKEHLRGIYLNTHHRVVHDEIISIGTIDANIVHPREVFKPAIEYGAVALVLVHNHPSGITKPSQADVDVTRQLVEAGRIIGINVLDHIIVAPGKFTSITIDYQV